MLRVAHLKDGRKAIIIRTSDRISFKKCRRSWSWSSHLKRNLGPSNLNPYLWFGSAVHYALEDYHGYKHFQTAQDAFRAYCIATSKQSERELPDEAPELFGLGSRMMDYYENYWLKSCNRKQDETYWEDGIPQVEVNFEIPVPLEDHPLLEAYAKEHGADCVLYRGTIDRIAIDEYGRLWVVEYKTAKRAEHMHYQTDPQVTTYVWAATHMYPEREVAGVVYHQFVKNDPQPPRILSTGAVSTAKNLMTSVPLYERALTRMYGKVGLAPKANREYLTNLMTKEDENNDKYIQRTYIERNRHMVEAEAQKILLELEDMLNPDLPLYPNPTRDCSRMCSFLASCVSFDDGSDWEGILRDRFSERDGLSDYWRRRIPDPERLSSLRENHVVPDLFDAQLRLQNMPDDKREAVERGEAELDFTFNMES
jgi:hypothetical protein